MRNNSANGDYVSRVTKASSWKWFRKGEQRNKTWKRKKWWRKEEERKMQMGKWNKESLERMKCHWGRVTDRLCWSEGADSRVTGDDVFITVRAGVGGIVDGEKCQSQVFSSLCWAGCPGRSAMTSKICHGPHLAETIARVTYQPGGGDISWLSDSRWALIKEVAPERECEAWSHRPPPGTQGAWLVWSQEKHSESGWRK